MQKIQEIAKALNIVPKLRLGNKVPGKGLESTGPHRVKFIGEPTVVMGKDQQGKPRKELRFIVEENKRQYRWNVPIMNKEGQPNYLIERLLDIEVGDERVLEIRKNGMTNYIDVRGVDEKPSDAPEEKPEEHEEVEEEDAADEEL